MIPRELLLEGPNGEYVFAGDAMAAGTLKEDLQRVVDAGIDAQYQLPVDAPSTTSPRPGSSSSRCRIRSQLDLAGTKRTFEDGAVVRPRRSPRSSPRAAPSGYDAARMQEALWTAVLDTAALRPGDVRAAAVRAPPHEPRAAPTGGTWRTR